MDYDYDYDYDHDHISHITHTTILLCLRQPVDTTDRLGLEVRVEQRLSQKHMLRLDQVDACQTSRARIPDSDGEENCRIIIYTYMNNSIQF